MSKFIFDNNALVLLNSDDDVKQQIEFASVFVVEPSYQEFVSDYEEINDRSQPSEVSDISFTSRHDLWRRISQKNIIKTDSDPNFIPHLERAMKPDSGVEYDIATGSGLCDIHIFAVADRHPGEYSYVTDDRNFLKALNKKQCHCLLYEDFKLLMLNRGIPVK